MKSISRQGLIIQVGNIVIYLSCTVVYDMTLWVFKVNNYIVQSYRFAIVVTKSAIRRTNKAKIIVLY